MLLLTSKNLDVKIITFQIKTQLYNYSHLDKEIAGLIKELFKHFVVECFLAHKDGIPRALWEREILENLKECNIFIPIITENFILSIRTDQECGAAIYRGIPIIPMSPDAKHYRETAPYGFIGKYQSMKLKLPDSKEMPMWKMRQRKLEWVSTIIGFLKQNKKLWGAIRRGAVCSWTSSMSFEETNFRRSKPHSSFFCAYNLATPSYRLRFVGKTATFGIGLYARVRIREIVFRFNVSPSHSL